MPVNKLRIKLEQATTYPIDCIWIKPLQIIGPRIKCF